MQYKLPLNADKEKVIEHIKSLEAIADCNTTRGNAPKIRKGLTGRRNEFIALPHAKQNFDRWIGNFYENAAILRESYQERLAELPKILKSSRQPYKVKRIQSDICKDVVKEIASSELILSVWDDMKQLEAIYENQNYQMPKKKTTTTGSGTKPFEIKRYAGFPEGFESWNPYRKMAWTQMAACEKRNPPPAMVDAAEKFAKLYVKDEEKKASERVNNTRFAKCGEGHATYKYLKPPKPRK